MTTEITFAQRLMGTVHGVAAYARKVAGLPLLKGHAMSDLRGCRIQLAQRGLTLWVPKRDKGGNIVTNQQGEALGTFFVARYINALDERTITRRCNQEAWETMTRDFGRRLPGIAGNVIYAIARSDAAFATWLDSVDQSVAAPAAAPEAAEAAEAVDTAQSATTQPEAAPQATSEANGTE